MHLTNASNSLKQGEMRHNDNCFNLHQTIPFYVALIPKSLDGKMRFYRQKEYHENIKQQVAFIENEIPCMILKNKTLYSEYKNPMQQAIEKLNKRHRMI
ncbi:hypothetical protein [Bacillus pseudomycoides]|uniref:hypothetical protein n=2 Tax=Bacillus pseudomycoides TaxID=64104 RepID=UPI00159BBFA2|nr:hypothetical protein [Bacillus pseudomycoides]